jgi:hypothetical protein
MQHRLPACVQRTENSLFFAHKYKRGSALIIRTQAGSLCYINVVAWWLLVRGLLGRRLSNIALQAEIPRGAKSCHYLYSSFEDSEQTFEDVQLRGRKRK